MMIDKMISVWEANNRPVDGIVPIDISSVVKYIFEVSPQETWALKKDVVNFAPPFQKMWLEYETPRFSNSEGELLPFSDIAPKFGILLDSIKTQKGWTIAVGVFAFPSRKQFKSIGMTVLNISEDGTVCNPPDGKFPCIGIGAVSAENVPPEIKDQLSILIMLNATWAGIAVSFMHCKNVQLIENKIPGKIQKARQRRGKAPKLNYYTLEISPVKKILSEKGNIEKTGIKQALHICRGHFKDYRDGRGLFGKYKGLYWWESQIRGSKDEGMIIKDYKVNPPKEVACK